MHKRKNQIRNKSILVVNSEHNSWMELDNKRIKHTEYNFFKAANSVEKFQPTGCVVFVESI